MRRALEAGRWMAPLYLTAWLAHPAGAATEPAAASLPAVELKDLDLRKGWFKPVPARDADPICATLANDARRYFKVAGEWPRYATAELATGTGLELVPLSSANLASTELRGLPDDAAQLVLERPNQPRLFLYFTKGRHCDASCNAQRLMVSDQRIASADTATTEGVAQTPEADVWTLYRANAGTWYAAGIVDQHLQLYALAAPAQWRLSCDVALAPYRLRASLDPSLLTTLTALDVLHGAVQGLDHEVSENCRRTSALKQTLEQTLYRPWQWLHAGGHDEYRQLLDNLEDWSSHGQDEHAAFERYNVQLPLTVAALQRFYVAKFGWSTPTATRVAYDALTGAIRENLAPMFLAESQCDKDVAGF